MSDHEVTRGEYKAVMGEAPSTASAYDKDRNELTGDDNVKNNPVNYVSWHDAIVYCNKRSIKENLEPCYAIGGETTPSKWGKVPTSSNYENYENWNAAKCDIMANGYRLPTEAEWEWCWDWYGSISSGTSSSGSASGSNRCLRGGSWYGSDNIAQVAHRGSGIPYGRSYFYGFRVVRTAK